MSETTMMADNPKRKPSFISRIRSYRGSRSASQKAAGASSPDSSAADELESAPTLTPTEEEEEERQDETSQKEEDINPAEDGEPTEATAGPEESKRKRSFIPRLSSLRNRSERSQEPAESSNAVMTPPPKRREETEMPTPPLTPVREDEELKDDELQVDEPQSPQIDEEQKTEREGEQQEAEQSVPSVTKDGIPVITAANADKFRPSDVNQSAAVYPDSPERDNITSTRSVSSHGSNQTPMSWHSQRSPRRRGGRSTVVLAEAPSAKQSAYAGPPRYDWIDIETAAAVKVQAAFRRNQVMWELEKQGLSTAAMRNRARQRQSTQRLAASEDVPSLFRLCGIGFLFGDSTAEEQEARAARRKAAYEEKKRQKEEQEEKRRKFRMRKKGGGNVVESVEVVE